MEKHLESHLERLKELRESVGGIVQRLSAINAKLYGFTSAPVGQKQEKKQEPNGAIQVINEQVAEIYETLGSAHSALDRLEEFV